MDLITISEPVECDILAWPDLTEAEQEEYSWLATVFDQNQAKFCRFDGLLVLWSDWATAPSWLASKGGWQRYEQENPRLGTVLKVLDEKTVQLANFTF